MVDCLPRCCQRRGRASASLLTEQVGVTDDLGAFRHFYVLDHPEGQGSLRKHLRPTFPVDIIVTSADNTVHKHPSQFVVDIHTDTLTLTMNKKITPYLTFSMSHGPKNPTTILKDSYMEGDNKILKLKGYGRRSKGSMCCKGTHEEEFEVELFFVTTLLRDYVASVLSGLGHQDSEGIIASKVASPFQSLKIFVGSWNFGNNPPAKNLNPWIPKGRYDLYAIGMQESPGENIKLIKEHLNDDYVSIKDEVMGVIRLIVLVRKTMVQYIHRNSVESFHVASGILGGMGINKGGVGVALHYRNTPIAFIASHLAARATAKRNRRRNKDVRTIVEKMSFGLNNVDVLHQYNVFWLGDLNYRITLPWEETVKLIKSKQWEKLRQHDQLLIEQAAGRVFYGYNELDLNFPPTYKYIDFKNTTVWDPIRRNNKLLGHICKTEKATASSRELAAIAKVEEGDTHFFLPSDTTGLRREYTRHKMQTPSWTDRILNKPLPGVIINQETAGCADEIQTSDHTPTFATYNMRIPLPPPAAVNFLKCTIHVQNVKLSNPRLQGEGFGGVEEEEEEEEEDDEEDEDNQEDTPSPNNSSLDSSPNPGRKKKTASRRVSVFGKMKKEKLSPVVAMHLPFLSGITKRTAYKSAPQSAIESTSGATQRRKSTTSKNKASLMEGRVFSWRSSDMPVMGPFFTKMEFMEHRHIIFRVQGNAGHGAAGNTIGYCTVSLAEIVEKRRPIRFQSTLLRGGQPAGELTGEILIKWLDSANNVIGMTKRTTRGSRSGETKSSDRSGGARITMVRNPSLNENEMVHMATHSNPMAKKKRPRGTITSRSMQISKAERLVELQAISEAER